MIYGKHYNKFCMPIYYLTYQTLTIKLNNIVCNFVKIFGKQVKLFFIPISTVHIN